MSGCQSGLTVGDMLGKLPKTTANNSATTQSSVGIESSTSETDASFSLPNTDKEYFCKASSPATNSLNAFFHLNSQYFNQDLKSYETFSTSKYKPFGKVPSLDIDASPRKSTTGPLPGDTESFSSLMKTKLQKQTIL
ncbi:Tyrosine-protein kinase [Quillaja saponaria]|uniref:Tyrosine-protein kinase n=1 Tax=Quillaja saponaria TaxID=32244 RepID=A0AAD7VJU3_QUISA|nr:Tyrosine-protein kinase [Quillaja saponaria]